MNLNSSLTNELRDKESREAYVASQIRVGMPFQIRGLRKSLQMNQAEFAECVGMSQPRVSELEKPGARSLNLDTLLRVAAGADVALQVRFVPFSELIDWSERFDPDNFFIPTFKKEISEMEKSQTKADLSVEPTSKIQTISAKQIIADVVYIDTKRSINAETVPVLIPEKREAQLAYTSTSESEFLWSAVNG